MSASPNLRLPYLDANQNQKSVTHNAALRMLDALVNIRVASASLAAPPAAPNDGQSWIVASGGTGAWLGRDFNVAAWQDGAWSYYAPNPGFVAYVDALAGALMWNGTTWASLIGAITQLALTTLGVGTAADAGNPLSAKLNAALFTALPTTATPAGTGDVRVKLSKQAAANSAALLFQDAFSGRAEIGLVGDDSLHLRVSPDGATFTDALVLNTAGGAAFAAAPIHPSPAPGDSSNASATTAWVVAKGYAAASAVAAGFARTQVTDAAYAVKPGDRTVAVIALSAARSIALPAAAAYPQGATLTLVDESGACSAANTLTLSAAGSDTLNGAAAAVLSTPYAYLALVSNGANKWTIVDQPAAYGWVEPQGRLTLQGGTPVMTAAVSGASGVIYTPYVGNLVGLWNGAQFVAVPFTEVGQALSDMTKSPSAAVAGQVYDMFGWMDGTTLRVTRGPSWSAGAVAGSTTARGGGAGSTALSRVQGVLVNQNAVAGGPPAGFGTYLGTVATDAGGATVSFNTGSAAPGGGSAMIGVWNAYNRVTVSGQVRDTTNAWSYATAAWRPAGGSGSLRVGFVAGLPDEGWEGAYDALGSVSAGAWMAGVGLNTAAAATGVTGYAGGNAVAAIRGEAVVQVLGLNTLTALEYANGGTLTGYGTAGLPAVVQSGLTWRGRY